MTGGVGSIKNFGKVLEIMIAKINPVLSRLEIVNLVAARILAEYEYVFAIATRKTIPVGAAVQHIISCAARKAIASRAAAQVIIAVIAVKTIAISLTGEDIIAISAFQPVLAIATIQIVIAIAAVQSVATIKADDQVVVCRSIERIAPIRATDTFMMNKSIILQIINIAIAQDHVRQAGVPDLGQQFGIVFQPGLVKIAVPIADADKLVDENGLEGRAELRSINLVFGQSANPQVNIFDAAVNTFQPRGQSGIRGQIRKIRQGRQGHRLRGPH